MTAEPGERPTSDDRALVSAVPSHAPTLLTGAAPGLQGCVRIWKPDLRLIRRQAVAVAVCTVVFLAAGLYWWLSLHDRAGALVGCLAIETAAAGIIIGRRHCLRPQYLTTDDAGIGVTTATGSRVFRWREITGCFWGPAWGAVRLSTDDVPSMTLALPGFPRAERLQLVRLIRERSGVTPRFPGSYSGKRENGWFLRRGYFSTLTGEVLPEGVPTAELLAARGCGQLGSGSHPSTLEWKPRRWRLQMGILGGLVLCSAVSALVISYLPRIGMFITGAFVLPLLALEVFAADPSAITYLTDNEFIRLGSGPAARRIRWSAIEGMEVRRCALTLRTSERETLLLLGHPREQVKRLVGLIAERAGLSPCPNNPKHYLSSGALAALAPGDAAPRG